MAIYSASQLLGKTFYLRKAVTFYKIFDINNLGDDAKPAGRFKVGQYFVPISFLLPTNGHTQYGIVYAKRSYPLFVFTDAAGTWYGVKIIGDGRFNVPALRAQGAITVKEEIERDKKENESLFDKIFSGAGGVLKTVAIVGGVGLIALYVLPRLTDKK